MKTRIIDADNDGVFVYEIGDEDQGLVMHHNCDCKFGRSHGDGKLLLVTVRPSCLIHGKDWRRMYPLYCTRGEDDGAQYLFKFQHDAMGQEPNAYRHDLSARVRPIARML